MMKSVDTTYVNEKYDVLKQMKSIVQLLYMKDLPQLGILKEL